MDPVPTSIELEMSKSDFVAQQAKELQELSDAFDNITEMKPYAPNRAERRAASKNSRKKQRKSRA